MRGLITYDCPHLKTAEIIKRCPGKIQYLFTIPFKDRPKRKVLINHRPYQFVGKKPEELADHNEIMVLPISELIINKDLFIDELIVGGAGILKPEIVDTYKVINAHPGLIPLTRGLDSFKWAIYYQELMGITIHQINSDVDLGRHIHHSETSVNKDDSIETLALRHYQNEINSLCSYINSSLEFKKIDNLPLKDARKRMSFEKEHELVKGFKAYTEIASIK